MGHALEERQRAFERLFRDTRTDLLAYALRRSQTAEDAADILAETYLIAWRRLETIPTGELTRPWLFGVARNLLLKGASRRRSADALVLRLGAELRNVGWRTQGEDRDRRDDLLAALAALSQTDREILTLTAWERQTPKQIAATLGVSANVVRVRLHRARTRVRLRLRAARMTSRGIECVAVEREF